jgi:L-ascorbate peroxidase
VNWSEKALAEENSCSRVRERKREDRKKRKHSFCFSSHFDLDLLLQQNVTAFPARGGANGSIRFKNEAAHGANKGLDVALALLAPVAAEFTDVSFADLFQLAGATAVEVAGGPSIPMKYGRKDAPGPESETPEGNLPAGGSPWPQNAKGPAEHLRCIFGRMGMDDKEIVALSGAHTLGRAKPTRSGFGKDSTKYTCKGPGTPGGSSWCKEWLKWDNEYFANLVADAAGQNDPELLVLETDACLVTDPGFKPFAERYAADPKAFDADYAAVHAKLSELGVEWE